MTSSRQPPELDRYLARRGIRPHSGRSTWFDRDTGQDVIRVVREPGEQTELISLTPRGVCLYKAVFSPGNPDAVIIAAVEAALSPPPPRPAGTGPGWPQVSGTRTREAVTCDDDR
jgi:hypothetical protein